MDIFAKRLKFLREKKKKENSKYTQGYLADLIGVARVTYTAYENGTKQPPMETINKIADIFNVSTDYLSGRTDTPNPEERVSVMFRSGGENLTEDELEHVEQSLKQYRELKERFMKEKARDEKKDK
ncbi:helix-turn-helix domain-containing protein [Bacillus sp. 03113]|uniref:helix-turn-helix domain-containing protein n=1 Tax=Bacillus sp. 03113 TaxID=2578211 RepID=UPI001143B084|nr:helix-turn-helix transcriptional regulator [Bacillus sp. 03113]